MASETERLLLGREFRQPDQRSCGAAVAVMAEGLRNERYARQLLAGGAAGFAQEVLAMHQRLTGPVDVAGSLQTPWLRLVGTPPWALARQLEHRATPRVTVLARLRPDRAWLAMNATLARGDAVPLYVGSRLLPRHVVLAVERLEDGIRAYEPASGRLMQVSRASWTERRLRLAGWREPWFAVAT